MNAIEKALKVLTQHQVKRSIRDMHTHCECGWVSAAMVDGWHEHAYHQAEQIVAAQRRKEKK